MIDQILAKLRKVKKTSSNRWLACCPAHEDKSPSLSIMQNETGKIFVHCFAGCDGNAIMAAMGMTLADLYPEQINASKGLGKRPAFSAYDVLPMIEREAQIVAMCATELQSHPLPDVDRQRLFKAVQRIQAGLAAVGKNYV
jgi:protein tyrosine phosphatase